MQRTSDIMGIILLCVQIPLAVVCGLYVLDVPYRAEWLMIPSIFGAFALAAGLLLIVAILQRKRVLWMRSSFRWFAIAFTIGVWSLMSYTLKSAALLFPLLSSLPILLRVWSSPTTPSSQAKRKL
jgi:hypothetical protein